MTNTINMRMTLLGMARSRTATGMFTKPCRTNIRIFRTFTIGTATEV